MLLPPIIDKKRPLKKYVSFEKVSLRANILQQFTAVSYQHSAIIFQNFRCLILVVGITYVIHPDRRSL